MTQSLHFPLSISAIVIDLDGTLLHTAPELTEAANRMLRDMDYTPVASELLMSYIGNGISWLVKRALTGDMHATPDAALYDHALPIFEKHYTGLLLQSKPFDGVIEGCAESLPDRPRTWINDRIRTLYRKLYERRHCHSIEVYDGDRLVGGLYGVTLGRAYFGESMFHRTRDASKVALVHLVARLKAGGFRLLDTQFVTDHLKNFGAVELPRRQYHKLLEAALVGESDFLALGKQAVPGAQALAQFARDRSTPT